MKHERVAGWGGALGKCGYEATEVGRVLQERGED